MTTSVSRIDQIMAYTATHAEVDPNRLLLGSNEIPAELRAGVALQLRLRSKIARKLPAWSLSNVFIPSRLSLEQCSSERTADFKSRFVRSSDVPADLTGGFGVDILALNAVAKRSYYVEQDSDLCTAFIYNSSRLTKHPPVVLHGDSIDLIPHLLRDEACTLFYIDPFRRKKGDEHVRCYAIEDCTPNLIDVFHRIAESRFSAPRVLAKLSPMLDISLVLQSLQPYGLSAVYVVADKGEVKELLVYCDPELVPIVSEDIPIYVVELWPARSPLVFSFTRRIEADATVQIGDVAAYIYEPTAALMKAGAFGTLSVRHDLLALHPNTHLFTSENLVEGLPVRTFCVEEVLPLSKKTLRELASRLTKASVSCRNFPLSSEDLRKRLGVIDDEYITIFATTSRNQGRILILCRKK